MSAGMELDIGQLRMLLDWSKDGACALFLRLLRERRDSHDALLRSPKTDARRVDFERGGLDAVAFIEKLLTDGIESCYRQAVEQEPLPHGRSRDASPRDEERDGGLAERGPE